MKTADLIIQTVLMACALVLFIATMLSAEYLMWVLLLQAALGVYQMFSATTSWFLQKPRSRAKCYHLVLSGMYLGGLFVLVQFPALATVWFIGYLILPPWVLAGYYYVVSWKSFHNRNIRQSTFLPHTSF